MRPRNMSRAAAERGMTLVEVLVAMLVLGTAAASLVALLAVHTSNISSLRDRGLARIAAENVMVRTVLSDDAEQFDATSELLDLGGRSFRASIERRPAPLDGVEVLTVVVRNEETEQVLAELSTLRVP